MKPEKKLIITTPRFSFTSLSTSSGTFRGWFATQRADECEKITGALLTLIAAFIVSGEWWIALFPGLALMLAVFCFNLLGDGLRDLIDPRRRT